MNRSVDRNRSVNFQRGERAAAFAALAGSQSQIVSVRVNAV
jgi:hypothetical protein